MDVIDMGRLHPELFTKEEKICVISDVMGETQFFGRNECQELAPTAEVTMKVRWVLVISSECCTFELLRYCPTVTSRSLNVQDYSLLGHSTLCCGANILGDVPPPSFGYRKYLLWI
jgi:hypothetical protein